MRLFTRSIVLFALLVVVFGVTDALGQSTDQNFPTPITSNEISGTIKARDVGDARITSYDGSQGDVFINVLARNFAGDIDVFAINGLRPLAKIVVYGDFGDNETGRVIYLRKPEKMILRVQGRTPGDEPATFRIKFAGSFVASTMTESVEPALPSLTARNENGIKVNSVGTIVEVIPKATPTPAALEASAADARRRQEEAVEEKADSPSEAKADETAVDSADDPRGKKLEVVVTDPSSEKPKASASVSPVPRRRTRTRTPPKTTPPANSPATTAASGKAPSSSRVTGRAAPAKTTSEKVPNPLENVNLVIRFKDGRTINRPMSEVLRFSVDRGMLTIISKDGTIGRYSILDVEKLTIQ